MSNRKSQIAILAGLLALCCLVQVVAICRATVPAQDAVRFVNVARLIERDGMLATLRTESQQPLFPLWLWLIHEALRQTIGDFRSAWAVSAQLAAAIPLVLAVLPVYLISLRLLGPAPALAGSLLFCVLPEVSRLGADGISDSMHLLLFSLAFWAVAVYLSQADHRGQGVQGSGFRVQNVGMDVHSEKSSRPATGRTTSTTGSPRWLLPAGVATGLALLTRAEVVLLPAALAVSLLVFQFQPHRRQPWSRLAAAAGCLMLGFGLVFGPYLVAVGSLTPRTAISRALGRYQAEDQADQPTPAAPGTTATNLRSLPGGGWRLADGRPMSFDYKEPTISLRRRGYAAAVALLAEELADAYGYWVGAFALLGYLLLRRRLRRPVDRFVQIFFLSYLLAVLHFAAAEGYLSARHLLMLVVPGIAFAGYGLLETGRLANRRRVGGTGVSPVLARDHGQDARATRPGDLPGSRVGWGVVLLGVTVCLTEAMQPLHAGRQGHRNAAEWLATQAEAPGVVLDTRGWTGLYSGRATYTYEDARTAFSDPRLAYVVLESRELEYPSDRSRTLRQLLRAAGEPVATFPDADKRNPGRRSVVVYRWKAERSLRTAAGSRG